MPALRLVIDRSGGCRLYAHGILVPGVRGVVAHPGAPAMLVLDEAALLVERSSAAPEQDHLASGGLVRSGRPFLIGERSEPNPLTPPAVKRRLATDGQA